MIELFETFGKDNQENMLISGDNLGVLNSIKSDFIDKIKLIYIDPPYNTGNNYIHYNDNSEHSLWQKMMEERLVVFYSLLSNNGDRKSVV